MTDSSNNDNNVQKRREIYEFPVSLLRLFGINIANLLGRRQFYRWLNKEKSFPSEMTDLIEELIIESIVEQRQNESGVDLTEWVLSDKIKFDYFFEHATIPKKLVWLFYLSTFFPPQELLTEQLASKNIPDFMSLNLPFYSSETIIFLEKSAFGEVETSFSVVEKHLSKFLESNEEHKGTLLLADYENYVCNTESESSDDEEETESDISDISEEDWICENWFTKEYVSTELKSKSLFNLYSDDLDSRKTEKKIKDILVAKSAEVGWSSKDPIFVVSKDLNALVELWDSNTKKISLKWRDWIESLRLINLLKTSLQKIYFAYGSLRNFEETTFTDSVFSESEEDKTSLQKTFGIISVRLEKCLILLERLEKCEWKKGDEKKGWREWKKSKYGYRNWGKFIKLVSLKPELKIVEVLQRDKELVPYLDLEKVKDWSLFESLKTLYDENLNMIEEKVCDQEQILYQVRKDI